MLLLAIAIAATLAGVWLFVRGSVRLYRQLRQGQPSPQRLTPPGRRLAVMVRQILTHERFTARPVVKVAHWFVMMSFIVLVPTLAAAYAQTIDPLAGLPLVGGWPPWQWAVEFFAWTGLIGIIALVVVRARFSQPEVDAHAARDWKSRFYGSTRWQAYFVEAVIGAVVLCVIGLHAAENALLRCDPATAAEGSWIHFPTTYWLGSLLLGLSPATLAALVSWIALAKILISMTWMGVVGYGITMSVAWHRFLGVINAYAKREPNNEPALGAAAPMLIDGEPFDIRTIDELPEDASFGVTTVTDFGWKALLDFASCSECGRCQDLCPAWNTGKPLSPKLFTLALRDHAAAALAPGRAKAQVHSPDLLASLAAAKAAGELGDSAPVSATTELIGAVIDPDVLWACTTCGACVEACPVDIEHVDHILDLRRGEVMTKSQFPAEFSSVFSNLDNRQNPWGSPARGRLAWTKGLGFPVPVAGEDIGSLTEVDYLLWVGCAGAYDEKAKKTTRAVAELLHLAGVSFAILGTAETCCGDPARRAGNEASYQMAAVQNIETLTELGANQILVTCAHCLNTLSREYKQLGADFKLTHHTQLLNRLVREHRLELTAPTEDERTPITYHDPCYLGRHNGEYQAPRELLAQLPGTELIEMSHHGPSSMCCGAGGARMWTEETIGTRISDSRLAEAADTAAATVATGCPYCSIMLGDAAAGSESAPVVQDVAHLVLASVKRGQRGGAEPAPAEPGPS